MKKTILTISILLLAISMLFILTNTVKAEGTTITDVTTLSGGSVQHTDNVYTITLTKDQINTLEWHSVEDPTGDESHRVVNGWDIGFKLTLSAAFSKGDLKVKYTNYENVVKSFDCTPDTNASEYKAWVSINENKLKGQTKVFQLAKFDFEIDGSKVTVIVNIDPTNVELKAPEGGRMVKVTVNGYEFTMEKGKNLTANKENGGLSEAEVEDLKALMTPKEGNKFVGLFIKGTDKKFTLDQVISSDLELEVRFEKLPEEPVAEDPDDEEKEEPVAEEKDNTPKTGIIDVALIASVVAMVSVAGIVTVKKYSK